MTQKANMHRGTRETHGPNERATLTRREFIKGIGIGGGALVLLGRFGINAAAWPFRKIQSSGWFLSITANVPGAGLVKRSVRRTTGL